MPPSTRNPSLIPPPARLEPLCRSLATLDAIVCREWEDRYYSFNRRWDRKRGHRMGSMRNGCGDDFFILFTAAGAAIKGYAHELSKPGRPADGMFEGFPEAITGFLDEPAFTMANTSFCLWSTGGPWSQGTVSASPGDDPDGSELLLECLVDDPAPYLAFAEWYYELELPSASVAAIYRQTPLTETLLASLNPDTSLADLAEDLDEIGYPVEGGSGSA